MNLFPFRQSIIDFRPCAVTDISPDVDYIDLICHIDLPFMHIIQHFFGLRQCALVHVLLNFIVARVAGKADADDNIALQRETLLSFHGFFSEADAAAAGDALYFPAMSSFSYRQKIFTKCNCGIHGKSCLTFLNLDPVTAYSMSIAIRISHCSNRLYNSFQPI